MICKYHNKCIYKKGCRLTPPFSAEIKNAWRYTSTPIRLHGVVLS